MPDNLDTVESTELQDIDTDLSSEQEGAEVQEPSIQIEDIIDRELSEYTEEDISKIQAFIEFAGGIPKGSKILMNKGKPHIHMKVNGDKINLSLDEIMRNQNIGLASEKELLKTKETRKLLEAKTREYEEALKEYITNPKKLFDARRAAGYSEQDIRDLAAQMLEEYIEEANMTDDEKMLRDMKSKLAKYEERDKQEEDKRKQEQEIKEVETFQAKYANDIINELKALGVDEHTSNKTKAGLLKGSLYRMLVAENNGVTITPKQAVRTEYLNLKDNMNTVLKDVENYQTLMRILPDNVVKIIREFNKVGGENGVKSIPTANSMKPTSKIELPKKKEETKKVNMSDYFRNLK